MIKKRLRGKFVVGFSAIVMSFMMIVPCSIDVYANEDSVIKSEDVEEGDYGIMPFSDIIEYRYKFEGTKVYRRLYNYTEQCWIGEWEYVGEGYIRPDV